MPYRDAEAQAEYQAKYRAEHRAELAAYQREWQRRHPGYNKSRILKRVYGVTLDDFNAMVVAQGGRCAICEREPSGPRGLHIDHDHGTGAIRGLLCNNCNNGLGRFQDNPETLMAAAEYLKRITTIT